MLADRPGNYTRPVTTLLCVPIMVQSARQALRDAGDARRLGADIVEYRVDGVFHGASDDAGLGEVERLTLESPCACIVTCRSADEGGLYDGDDASRIALYEHLGTLTRPPRYIDVELATYARSSNLRQKVGLAVDHPGAHRALSTGLILSVHDFRQRPSNLSRLVADMAAQPAASVHKIAFHARSLRDNLELFELLRSAPRPTIALGMGEFGLLSRVLAPKFGGFLTFASLRDSAATAPGQPTVDELLSLYRFRSIGPATQVFGVIGWPVSHSLSPRLHNAGFELLKRDAVYLPLPVPPEWEHFKATLSALLDDASLDFRGASVTIPHKQHLVRFAREDKARRWDIDDLTRRCGAANTLAVRSDGSCSVVNSDAPALVASLEGALPAGRTIEGMRVAVLGAGGAARSAACGLLRRGATVVVYNHHADRAGMLVRELAEACADWPGRIVVGPWDKLDGACCQAYVNCTPVGMLGGPDPEASPIPESVLRNCGAGGVVLDTVYNPPETPLIRSARLAGVRVVVGADMLTRQAVEQTQRWSSEDTDGTQGTAALLKEQYARLIRESLDPGPGL